MIFDYFEQSAFTKSVQVDDEGNFALRCTTAAGFEYYVIVKTEMGQTAIMKFGPIIPDMDLLFPDFSLTYKKFSFKVTIIEKDITSFINKPGKDPIVEVESILDYEAIEYVPKFTVEKLLGDE